MIMGEITDGPEAKYVQLAARLREQIATMAKGDRLPSETEIEQGYDVARGTIRKAFQVLRDEGLIVTVHGKGSYVA